MELHISNLTNKFKLVVNSINNGIININDANATLDKLLDVNKDIDTIKKIKKNGRIKKNRGS